MRDGQRMMLNATIQRLEEAETGARAGRDDEPASPRSDGGPRGILRLVVQWIFGLLQIALFARVITSWFSASPSHWWVRWSYTLTEPFLAPIRRLLPPVGGMLDLSPLVAYFALTLLSRLVVGAL